MMAVSRAARGCWAARGPGPARALRRERVNARTGDLADGGFSTSAAPALAEAETAAGPGAEGQEARPAGLAAAAPAVPPISEASLAALTAFVEQSRRLVVVTGAGVSTEVRSPGAAGRTEGFARPPGGGGGLTSSS